MPNVSSAPHQERPSDMTFLLSRQWSGKDQYCPKGNLPVISAAFEFASSIDIPSDASGPPMTPGRVWTILVIHASNKRHIFSEPDPNAALGGEETEMLFSNGLKSKVRITAFQSVSSSHNGLSLDRFH